MARANSLAYVLGGGKGERLYPLTKDRAKPAVPFGGPYRVIDFVLSNLYHSGVRKILMLTQYESRSLERHIQYGWIPAFGIGRDQFISILPARQSEYGGWYKGTADGINQNIRYVGEERPDVVNIFGGDHIYQMDVSQMNDFHLKMGADLTISAIPVKIKDAAKNFGVLIADKEQKLVGFEEKPDNPSPIPESIEYCLVSMGNYAFNPDILLEELSKDAKKEISSDKGVIAANPDNFSSRDFGYDIIPAMLRCGRKIVVYDFSKNIVPGVPEGENRYWKDIGTLDQFFSANMDIRATLPQLNLYNNKWPIFTYSELTQPAKTVEKGELLESICSNGTIISNSSVKKSVLSYGVRVNEGAEIENSILLGYNEIGRGALIKDAIIDRGVGIPNKVIIGADKNDDRRREFTVTPSGITVVPKYYKF